jgi:hypothetical protein
MTEYFVRIYNDMGHLHIETDERYHSSYSLLPWDHTWYIGSKVREHTTMATDLKGLGCRFWVYKEGCQTKWTYTFQNDILHTEWNLDTFDPTRMKYIDQKEKSS